MPQRYIKCSRRFADIWGLDVAVVMEQVKYWLTRNATKTDCIHDDAVWFYCSIRELTEKYFPYWTPRQLARLMEYMVTVGLLRVGRFNKKRYDRTKWYTVVDARILTEEDYVPERKSITKRRAISRPSVCSRVHEGVQDSDADVGGCNAYVEGSNTEVKSIAPSCSTYTTTKQQLTTEKETEKEQLNIFTPSLRSDVEGGKELPSKHLNPLSDIENRLEDYFPLQNTEGVSPRVFVKGVSTVRSAAPRRAIEEKSTELDELFEMQNNDVELIERIRP